MSENNRGGVPSSPSAKAPDQPASVESAIPLARPSSVGPAEVPKSVTAAPVEMPVAADDFPADPAEGQGGFPQEDDQPFGSFEPEKPIMSSAPPVATEIPAPVAPKNGIEVIANQPGYIYNDRKAEGDRFKIRSYGELGDWMTIADPVQEKNRRARERAEKLKQRSAEGK